MRGPGCSTVMPGDQQNGGGGAHLAFLVAGAAESDARLSPASLSVYFSMKTFIVVSMASASDVLGAQSNCCFTSRIDGMRRSESSSAAGRGRR